jgi:hypothetical protein
VPAASAAALYDAPRERVFAIVTDEGVLPEVLRGLGPIPAVTHTSELTGPWDVPGSQRRVHLADGSSAHEQLTVRRPPEWFGYRVFDLDGVFGRLVHEATGEWFFAEVEGGTLVHWTYRLYPRSRLARPALALFTRTVWKAYMGRVLDAVGELVERR